MTASEFIASPYPVTKDTVFARIEEMASARGVAMSLTLTGAALKLEFADGQRIVINHNIQTQKLWLAALSSGIEYRYQEGYWLAQHEQGELFANLDDIISQIIQSNHLNSRPGKLINLERLGSQAMPLRVAAPQSPGLKLLSRLTLLGLLAWLGYSVFRDDADKSVLTQADSRTLMVTRDKAGESKCEATLPQNGTTHIFPVSNIQQDDPSSSEVALRNDHSYAMMVIFTAPQSVIPYFSVLLNSRQSAKVKLPAGQYDLLFSVGNTWCNLQRGFRDGQRIKLNRSLTVVSGQPMGLILQSSGPKLGDFQTFIDTSSSETSPPATQFSGDGVMEIRKHRDGHFHLAGTINGAAVTYLVDTGASLTSLSRDTAQRAGIVDCKPATFKTANGSVEACVALVPQLTLGNYQMQHVNVAVMPNLEVDLLGMNMLKHFAISQDNEVMRLTRH